MSDNPYQSNPQELPPPTATADRPTSVTVFGVLNILFAVMGLCGIGASIAMFFMPQNPDVPNPVIDVLNSNAAYRAFTIASTAIGFIFLIVLTIGGIGLLKWRQYGRTASIAYGWYTVVAIVVATASNWFFVFGPLIEQVQQAQGPQQAAAIGGIVGGMAGGCFGIIYPALLLFFMYRPKVKAALT